MIGTVKVFPLLPVFLISLAASVTGADPDSPADFTITTTVAVEAPDRYGTNVAINGYADFNCMAVDPGFEPFVIRRNGVATGGGADYIENANGPTTTSWDTLADGFFDGAAVRVYRVVSGQVTLLRTGTVSQYIGGWNRVISNRLTSTQYKDGGLASGKTYFYAVKAYDTSGNLSGYSNVVTAVAQANNGVADTVTGTFTPTVTESVAPAAPSGLSATANGDGTVSLAWTANPEADLAGYYVYRAESDPALHNRIFITGSTPAVQAGDFYFLDLTTANPPMEKVSPRVRRYFSLNDTWREVGGSSWPYNQAVTKLRDTSTVCPENGGRSRLKLTAPGAYEVSIRQYRYAVPDGYYGALVPGRSYRVEVWLRQEGIATGAVTFKMNNAYSAVSRTWTGVTGSWQKFTHEFVAPDYPAAGTGTVEQMFAFTGPGSVWLDNFLLYDPSQPPFALRTAAKQQLVEYAPGWVRSHTGHTNGRWGSSMDDWTNTDALAMNQWSTSGGRGRPEQPYHLPFILQLIKDAGTNPWLVVGSYMDEQEWANFIEYLAGPAGTPYGDKRIAQRGGITTPWTDEFSRIRIEYGNEMWNPSFEWTLSGSDHGRFAEYFFHKAAQSPYFAALASKVDFAVNGQLVSTGIGGYSAQAMQVPAAAGASSRYATSAELALYLGGWDANIILGGGTVNDAGYTDFLSFSPSYGKYWFDLQATTRDQVIAATGRSYKLANYESAPGYALPSGNAPFDPVSEAYGKSLAAGVSTLDSFLYGTLKKIDPQCYFTLQSGVNWSSHSYVAYGNYPQPSWQALQMRNRYASGDMIATATNSTPTRDVPAWINSTNGGTAAPAMPNMPLVACYAFRDGTKYSTFVLSRKLTGDTPVTLRFPFTSVSSGTLYKLTGDPRARNDQGTLNIQETQEPVTDFAPNYPFSMPPGSVFLFVFDGAVTATETNPGVTISQFAGQSDPTSSQSISFAVHFSQPVTGFTASDVVISGTAGATVAGVAEIDPFLGTDYRVDVSGMTGSGTVTISIPPNAATNGSGQGNLASTAFDNSVQFNLPPFAAYDDFNLAPSSPPNPPFLNGVTTGAGFSAGWQLTGFNAATYGDGYKLAAGTPLSYLNLRRTGNYAVGGKDYGVAARVLDVDNTFGFYKVSGSSPSVIGRSGTTLWISALVRKDTMDANRLLLFGLNNSADISVGGSRFGFGYGGDGTPALSNGTRYWSLQVRNAGNNGLDYVRSNVPVVTGQTSLLVLKISFGAQDRFDLYVNPAPLGGAAPATPDATWTTTGATDITFHTLGYSGGTTGANQSAIDEIRFGQNFAGVTPTFTPVETWRLNWFGAPDGTGLSADDKDYDGDGLPNLLEYALNSPPNLASPGSIPIPGASDNRFRFSFTRNLSAADLTYVIEATDDLAALAWTPLATKAGSETWSVASGANVSDPGSGSVTVTDAVDMSSAPRRFLKLRIVRP